MVSEYLQLKPGTTRRHTTTRHVARRAALSFGDSHRNGPLGTLPCARPGDRDSSVTPSPCSQGGTAARDPPTCLSSPLSAGNPWTGTAPCPAGRPPRKTSAAPSASLAGCAPSPEPSARAPRPGRLRKQRTLRQGLSRDRDRERAKLDPREPAS